MKLKKDPIQLMNANEMYEYFKPNIDTIYQLYLYLDISIEDYKKHVLKVLKENTKFMQNFTNDEEYLDYIEEQIKTSLDEKVKKMLKNKKNSFSVINNYINTNFKETQSCQEALTYFNQLDKFFQKYYYFPDMNLWIKLIEENTRVFQMINLIMEHFHTQITEGKASTIFNNDTLVLALEIYCTQKNIKMPTIGSFAEEEYELYKNDEDYDQVEDDEEYGLGEDDEEYDQDDEEKTNDFEAINSKNYYIQIIDQYPLLSREEERRLITLAKQNDEEAKAFLIKSNLRLVISIAKRYAHKCTISLSMEDLIQEGIVGLMKALEKFNTKKGCKFSTYATWWIRQAITRAIADKSKTIRLPFYLEEQTAKYKKAIAILGTKLYRTPTLEEIAQEMKLPLSQVQKIYNSNRDIISLYTKAGEDEEGELIDFIPSQKETPEELAIMRVLSVLIEEMFERLHLTETEKEIMRHRYGLSGRNKMSFLQIGKTFGFTGETARVKEARVLKLIRESKLIELLIDFAQNPNEAEQWIQEIRKTYRSSSPQEHKSYIKHDYIHDMTKKKRYQLEQKEKM